MSAPSASHPWKCFGKKEVKHSSRAIAGDSLSVFSFILFPARESTELGPVSGKWDPVSAKDQFPAGRSLAFGGPRSGVPKGHHPRLQNSLANSLGPLRQLKGEVLCIYLQFRKTKPELQVLCHSLSMIIIIVIIIIIIIIKK